jgi:hypothetical protein
VSNDGLLSLRLADILGASGWFEGRRVPVDSALSVWRGDGHVPTSAATDFVAEFDGLMFEYPRSVSVGGMDSCSLDAVAATAAIFPSVVREYEDRVGETLCPVGETASAHVTLMVGSSGRIYGGYDRFLAVYGDDGRHAVVSIFDRVKPLQVS